MSVGACNEFRFSRVGENRDINGLFGEVVGGGAIFGRIISIRNNMVA